MTTNVRHQAIAWLSAVPLLFLCGGVAIVVTVGVLVGSSGATAPRPLRAAPWQLFFESALDRQALVTSFGLAGSVATISVGFATVLAHALLRASRSVRLVFNTVTVAAVGLSAATIAFAWIALFGQVGILRQLLPETTWMPPPSSFMGVVGASLFVSVPIACALLVPAVEASTRLTLDAASVLNVSGTMYWRRVLGPMLWPYLASTWAVIFVWALGQFSIAYALLGPAASLQLAPVRAGTLLLSALPNSGGVEAAAVHSSLILLIAGIVLVVGWIPWLRARRWLLNQSVMSVERTELRSRHPLQPGRQPLSAVLLPRLAIAILLTPLIIAVLQSIALPGDDGLADGATLQAWIDTLGRERIAAAFGRSLALAIAAVGIALVLVVVPLTLGWVAAPVLKMGILAICAVAAVLPSLVIAFALTRTTDMTHLRGYVDPLLLLLASHVFVVTPFIAWPVSSALGAVGASRLYDAARCSGRGIFEGVAFGVLPAIRPAIVRGSLVGVAVSLGDYSLVRIIVGSSYETVPMWQVAQLHDVTGDGQGLAVVSAAVTLLVFAISGLFLPLARGQRTPPRVHDQAV